jgi:cobalamin biosynthesis Co2+ chelatase CbiK
MIIRKAIDYNTLMNSVSEFKNKFNEYNIGRDL